MFHLLVWEQVLKGQGDGRGESGNEKQHHMVREVKDEGEEERPGIEMVKGVNLSKDYETLKQGERRHGRNRLCIQ